MNDNDQLSGTVLIAEDHPPTSRLLELAFEEAAPGIATEFVETGAEAIDRLARIEDGATRPDLVILDLDLPIKSGYEVLKWRTEFDDIGKIPVVVASDTSDTAAASRCYDLNAQSFISKPEDWEGFLDLINVLVKYWFQYAKNQPVRSVSDGSASELGSTQQ